MLIESPAKLLRALRDQVRASAKNVPGTYRMLAENGEVLYVGKSKRVRTRLLSYFRAKSGEKGRYILKHAHGLAWDYEPSEFAALLSELRLIKLFRPRFNVRHKRDPRYCFLKITVGAAPKILVVGQVSDDAATYFGPFRGGKRIVEAVRELNDVLMLRDCAGPTPIFFADQQDLFAIDRAPRCHRLDLRLCMGPCAGRCTEVEYRRQMALARAFLAGNADEPLQWLNEKMARASERWDFEYAAAIRERMRRLELLRDEFTRLRDALETLTFSYTVPGTAGDDRVYLIRRGTVRASVPAPQDTVAARELAHLAEKHFGALEADTALVSRHQVDEILLVSAWFRTHPSELSRTTSPAVGKVKAARKTRPDTAPRAANVPPVPLPCM